MLANADCAEMALEQMTQTGVSACGGAFKRNLQRVLATWCGSSRKDCAAVSAWLCLGTPKPLVSNGGMPRMHHDLSAIRAALAVLGNIVVLQT